MLQNCYKIPQTLMNTGGNTSFLFKPLQTLVTTGVVATFSKNRNVGLEVFLHFFYYVIGSTLSLRSVYPGTRKG